MRERPFGGIGRLLLHKKEPDLFSQIQRESYWYGKHSWVDRYMSHSINFWKEKTSRLISILSSEEQRKRFITEVDPNIQYQVLELVAKFCQEKPETIKSSFDSSNDEIIAKTFGEMVLFHSSSSDETKRIEFLKKYWRLCISGNSIKIFFLDLKRVLESNGNNLDNNLFIDYLSRLFFHLNNQDQSDLINNLPLNIANSIFHIKEIVEVRQKIKLPTGKA